MAEEAATSQLTPPEANQRRGTCSGCGNNVSINSVSRVIRQHGDCPGSGRPPVGGGSTQEPVAPVQIATDYIATDDLLEAIKATSTRTLTHIPKASRPFAAGKYTDLIAKVNRGSNNLDAPDTIKAWHNLLLFGNACLGVPDRGGKTLASSVNKAIRDFPRADNLVRLPKHTKHRRGRPSTTISDNRKLGTQVSKKIEEGNTVGALRLITSEDKILPRDETTAQALREKHPLRAVGGPPPQVRLAPNQEPLVLRESEVYKAIVSFPPGSSGGYTGVRPQHVKEMVNPVLGPAAEALLTEITTFVNNCLAGLIPDEIKPFFFGASLCALKKKGGGIRPIAVGNTLRRLVARAAVRSIRTEAATMLQPNQLGFGVPQGCEAAAHAARAYISSLTEDQAVVKLDFKNAFNSVKREAILTAVQEHCPSILPFVSAGYSKDSTLLFGKHEVTSAEGIQQGDPLAPFLFCIAVREITTRLSSELNIWFLDDGTLAGTQDSLLEDLQLVKTRGESMGLVLSPSKCEIIASSEVIIRAVKSVLPEASVVKPTDSTLLGAPLGHNAIAAVLDEKFRDLKRMEERIGDLDSHDALYLLTKCLTLPRLTYFLRCAPTFGNPLLNQYDELLRSIFRKALNLDLDDSQWDQATLPVRFGGIGIRKATEVALPAFLSSCTAANELVGQILPERMRETAGTHDQTFIEAARQWDTIAHPQPRPQVPKDHKQAHWDSPIMEKTVTAMIDNADAENKARLLAVTAPHAGDFLFAVPNAALGTRLSHDALRIGVALRLAAPILTEHRCICGTAMADQYGRHGLVCRKSQGKIARHEEVNDIIKRSLATARCPAQREPHLSRPNDPQKRPDGVTLLPWKDGKQVVWDYTCAATLASTYLHYSTRESGGAASFRESQKIIKYRGLAHCYSFVPIGSETLGSWGKCALKFLKELGDKLISATKDQRAKSFLFQRLSVAIQRGNACCVLGTSPTSEEFEEVFDLQQ